LGANIGDKAAQIRIALEHIKNMPETSLLAVSGFYRTQPVGYKEQDWFVNAAALVETTLPPRGILTALLDIEQSMGRIRLDKWGPRIIDLDVLFYDRRVIEEADLILPHPCLDQRRFVLVPLRDIAPDWKHPRLGLTPAEMLARLESEDQEVIGL
jgi:2-amino-4-hydroxy-6-hydroxymethyldihydropteridine diphosphokinase